MEDEEELVGSDGHCDLRFSLLEDIPYTILQTESRIIKLNLSNNRLSRIDKGIASLILLQDLNLSNNKLEHIDDGIAKCVRLRKVNFNDNNLKILPKSLLQCKMIEELCLGGNKIQFLPPEVSELPVLMRLEVQNNMLKSIPLSICTIPTLNDIKCENNSKELDDFIPIEIMALGSKLALWSLHMRLIQEEEKASSIKSCTSLEQHLESLHYKKIRLIEDISNLKYSLDLQK